MVMSGVHSYCLLDVIQPTAAEDVIDDIWEELDKDSETRCPNPSSFLITKSGFQKFQRKLQTRIFRLQPSLERI